MIRPLRTWYKSAVTIRKPGLPQSEAGINGNGAAVAANWVGSKHDPGHIREYHLLHTTDNKTER